MFLITSFLIAILVGAQSTLAGNLHGSAYNPSIISGGYGYEHVANRGISTPVKSVISSYSSTIVHPDSAIAHPVIQSSPHIGHHQHISTPLTHHSPLISGGLYVSGYNHGAHTNSYATQRSYTAPVAAYGGIHGNVHNGIHTNLLPSQRYYSSPVAATSYSGHGIQSVPLAVNTYGAHGGHIGQITAW